MPSSLKYWNERLERHFSSLASTRESSGLPIFALEHPLTHDEIEQMSLLLRKQIQSERVLGPFGACWVVYATEIGYGYKGDEYWQSFEEVTPGWEFKDRNSLRSRFAKFQQLYNGVRPTGPWAGNFRIIAWPITHAILPKYLQHQFAYAIYQIRFKLAGFRGLDSTTAGQLLSANSYDTSTRFQQFLQQNELTGRILLGLLGMSSESAPAPIYEPTLKRIVADLDKVQASRSRLREARSVVDQFKGLVRSIGESDRFRYSSPKENAKIFSRPEICPQLFLRHVTNGNWSVAVQIPSFAQVAALEHGLGEFLKRTRCRVSGATDVKPAGWILSHNRTAIIRSWPGQETPLIQFEECDPVIDHLLKTDCVISRGDFWLFRVGADGIAREIVGRVVRPGLEYIVVTKKPPHADQLLTKACSIECEGVSAYRIDVPEDPSVEMTTWLQSQGIELSRSVRLWPAGMPCRGWDGEGRTVWLTTETPCFGIVHDHAVTECIIKLNNGLDTVVPVSAVGEPVFIRLDPLPVGKHKLSVLTKLHDGILKNGPGQITEGFIELIVREPEPWEPNNPSHSGLIVTVDPHDSDLDEFWENKSSVAVIGPKGHYIKCIVSLEKSDGEEIFRKEIPGNFELPLSGESWSKKFEAFVQKEESSSWGYTEAATGRLRIDGGELGVFEFTFHRDISPLRWITRRDGKNIQLRIVDDSGLTDELLCKTYSMLNPVESRKVDPSKTVSSTSPGALYVAQRGWYQDAIVVSHGLVDIGFQGLGVHPDLTHFKRNRISVSRAILELEYWLRARLTGPLAEIRRSQVTRDLSAAIFEKLCGKRWAESEQNLAVAHNKKAALVSLQHRIDANSGFGSTLANEFEIFLGDFDEAVDWYFELSKRYGVSRNLEMSAFATALAFYPQLLSNRYKSDLDTVVKRAPNEQQLIRGARFGALLCSQLKPDQYARFVRKHI